MPRPYPASSLPRPYSPRTPTVMELLLFHTGMPVLVVQWVELYSELGRYCREGEGGEGVGRWHDVGCLPYQADTIMASAEQTMPFVLREDPVQTTRATVHPKSGMGKQTL